MKPNEVMIGDWVKHTNPKTNESYYAKVSGICPVIGNDHKQTGWVVRFHKDGEPLDNPCPVSCDPIPLTTEILKANGIELIEVGDNGPATPKINFNRYEKWLIHTTWKDTFLWYDRRAKYWHLHNMNAVWIHHVHELQHALRMIELAELADNFIIEKGGEE